MLCLKYYRAQSDGWKDYGNCDDCVMTNIDALRSFTDCRQSDVCTCNICARQPPTLTNLDFHVLYTQTLNLRRFKLTAAVTYQQCPRSPFESSVDFKSTPPPRISDSPFLVPLASKLAIQIPSLLSMFWTVGFGNGT